MADLTGVLRGHDLSHHNDVDAGRLQGDFVIARTAQAAGGKYGTTMDRLYTRHKANALRAGKLFSSYFYPGDKLTPQANVSTHAAAEPDRSVPVMIDWEAGAGNGPFVRAVYDEFRRAGFYVWGLYTGRWYWDSVGRPDLSWAPPLVQSRYVDTVPGSYASEYASTPETYWLPFGNQITRMLQFSSTVRDPAYPSTNLDGDAFKGTRAQLADWWAPGKPNPTPAPGELTTGGTELLERIHIVPPNKDTNSHRITSLPGTASAAIIIRRRIADGTEWPMWIGHIVAWGSDIKYVGHDPKTENPPRDPKVLGDRRYDLPGALWCDLEYSAAEEFWIDVVG